MKKVIEYIRLVFISFEFLHALAISALAVMFPSLLSGLGSVMKGNGDVLKWIPVLPPRNLRSCLQVGVATNNAKLGIKQSAI